MTADRQSTATFLLQRLGDSASAVLGACDAEGLDLADVLDVLADPYRFLPAVDALEVEEVLEWSWDDPIYCLVEYAGIARATRIVCATSAWREVDVVARHASVAAWVRATDAITDEVPLAEAYALATDTEVPDIRRAGLMQRLARVYPLEELAPMARLMSPDHAKLIGEALLAHRSPLAALEELTDEVDEADVVAALECFWQVAPDQGDSSSCLLSSYALLSRREFKPMRPVVRYAMRRGAPAWWIPILREQGFEASQATLHLIEAGLEPLVIVGLVVAGGYDDAQVMTALLDNGLGSKIALTTLRESGWRVPRMVEALALRGVPLSEVRRQLQDLGVPPSAQRELLTPHWEASLVDLIVGNAGSVPLLPRQNEP